MVQEQDVGITGGVHVSLGVLMTMGAFFAISLYNVIELNCIIFSTFKRRSGLYFWSFIFATWGIAPHAIGFVLKFFDLVSIWPLPVALVGVGFIAMVTGQSLVLYSRLHLVVQDARRIRWILYMIIFTSTFVDIPLMVLAFEVNSPDSDNFVHVFTIFDKVQIAIFFVQEALISIVYIYETIRLLGSGGEIKRKPLRRLLAHLLLVNLVVLILDITLLGIQYAGDYEIQVAYKAAVYSIKLKIEFSVLNRLVSVVQGKNLTFGNQSNNSNTLGTIVGNQGNQFDIIGSDGYRVGDMDADGIWVQPKDDSQRKVYAVASVIEHDHAVCQSDNKVGRLKKERKVFFMNFRTERNFVL